jgi:hypothetical protein
MKPVHALLDWSTLSAIDESDNLLLVEAKGVRKITAVLISIKVTNKKD